MNIKQVIQKFFWKTGYDISKLHRKQILDSYNIDTVLDVGANTGSFAEQLRCVGYKKRILSFEPLSVAFEELKNNAKKDPDWEVFNFALGDTEEERYIYIAGNSTSSSLLQMLPSHIKSSPESNYTGKEVINVKTLDSIFVDICKPTNNVYIKIDTQGFESKVLRGAEKSLSRIKIVQLEMSLVPLYESELLFHEMCMYMKEKGYSLIGLEPGFYDHVTGQVLQVDGIFHRI